MKFCTEPVFVDPRQVTAVVCLNFSHFDRYMQDRRLNIRDRRFVCITSREDCVRLYGCPVPVKVAIASEPLDMLEIAEELQRFVDAQTVNDLVRYGRPLNATGLAKRLKPYAIRPAGNKRQGTKVLKHYERAAFVDAWARYYQYRMPYSAQIREQMLTTTFPITIPNGVTTP